MQNGRARVACSLSFCVLDCRFSILHYSSAQPKKPSRAREKLLPHPALLKHGPTPWSAQYGGMSMSDGDEAPVSVGPVATPAVSVACEPSVVVEPPLTDWPLKV